MTQAPQADSPNPYLSRSIPEFDAALRQRPIDFLKILLALLLEKKDGLLRETVKNTITGIAFDAHDQDDEQNMRHRLERRSANGDEDATAVLTRKLQHRDHLRARYHEIKTWLLSLVNDPEGTAAAVTKIEELLLLMDMEARFVATMISAKWTPPGTSDFFMAYKNIRHPVEHASGFPPNYKVELTLESWASGRVVGELWATAPAWIEWTTDNPHAVPAQPVMELPHANIVPVVINTTPRISPFVLTMTHEVYGERKSTDYLIETDITDLGGHVWTDSPHKSRWLPTNGRLPKNLMAGRFEHARVEQLVIQSERHPDDSRSPVVRIFLGGPSGTLPNAQDPEFDADFLANGMFRVTAGSHVFEFPAPNASENTIPSATQPYVYELAASHLPSLQAFCAAVELEAASDNYLEFIPPPGI